MSEQKLNREYFDGLFDENAKVEVTFKKKNGDTRIMVCTKNMDLIPTEYHPKPLVEGEEPKPPSDVVCSVFDLEANGWRSFRYDSVFDDGVKIIE